MKVASLVQKLQVLIIFVLDNDLWGLYVIVCIQYKTLKLFYVLPHYGIPFILDVLDGVFVSL
jgi:hypothetical protein